MKTKRIALEVAEFMARTGVSGVTLAQAAGISPVVVSRLKNGVRGDTRSTTADKLREAMRRIEEEQRAGR